MAYALDALPVRLRAYCRMPTIGIFFGALRR